LSWSPKACSPGEGDSETNGRFVATDLVRVCRVARLISDFEASMPLAATMFDLIENIERLLV
jgi:hypothetical protein